MKKAEVKKDKTVTCPHCHRGFAGNAVDEAARQGYPIECHCGKKFQPVLPKEKK
ncbi:MAG: hypothetical protein Q8N56_01580 [bacterium]|nr:hypothetical protein [bacterium]